MKKIFRVLTLSFCFFTFCFNPIVQAHETSCQAHYGSITRAENQINDSTEIKQEDEIVLGIKKNQYRPKMYRKVMGGVLFGLGITTAIGIIGFAIQNAIVNGGLVLPLLFCCLLAIPITACCVGFAQF